MTRVMNIIGAGKLGQTLGYLWAKEASSVQIAAICNRSAETAQAAIKFIGSGFYCPSIEELPPADVTLIATSDDQIPFVATALSQTPCLQEKSIVFHCSGSLSSEILKPLSAKNCWIASVHPMQSFAKPELSITQYAGTYCALEGDALALKVLQPLFEKIGSITYEINPLKKSSYHAAGVFSSNYLVTLASQALDCLQDAGVEKNMAIQVISRLMKGSINNLETTHSAEKALTGPIQRGDVSTIQNHLAVLNEVQTELYQALGKATLALTHHDEEQQKNIKKALGV